MKLTSMIFVLVSVKGSKWERCDFN